MLSEQINSPIVAQNRSLLKNLVKMSTDLLRSKSVLKMRRKPFLRREYQNSISLLGKMKVRSIEDVGNNTVSKRP